MLDYINVSHETPCAKVGDRRKAAWREGIPEVVNLRAFSFFLLFHFFGSFNAPIEHHKESSSTHNAPKRVFVVSCVLRGTFCAVI